MEKISILCNRGIAASLATIMSYYALAIITASTPLLILFEVQKLKMFVFFPRNEATFYYYYFWRKTGEGKFIFPSKLILFVFSAVSMMRLEKKQHTFTLGSAQSNFPFLGLNLQVWTNDYSPLAVVI